MMVIPLIGISGKFSSGKSTLANVISLKDNYTRQSFAEGIRDVIECITGIDKEYTRSLEDKSRYLEEYDMTIGELLQKIGTEFGRAVHIDIWVNKLFGIYKE